MSAQGMPPHILALFAPRPPMEFLKPLAGSGRKPVYTGITNFLANFETTPPPPKDEKPETPQERKARLRKEALKRHQKQQDALIRAYEPHKQLCVAQDPYKTLFVARLSYETTEKRLQKEFEKFGPIKTLKIVTDKNNKSRGYAFIEYDKEVDMRLAYKRGDGLKIDGRRVLVDVERSRTVENWLPRRLGGGKGKPRGQRQPTLPAVPPPLAPQQQQQRPPPPYSHHQGPPPSYRRPYPPPSSTAPYNSHHNYHNHNSHHHHNNNNNNNSNSYHHHNRP